ncbi:PP0621 family protein [Lacisediminimonas profundi]|uniref:PP0621 family protein n=1 Tax=Lacisediminimonas profundi TaxID=2603856 RepID=UPI00124B8833|nr:PP0621 family protein [Lacisediminimonas profundi]
MKLLLWAVAGFLLVMWYLHVKKSNQRSRHRDGPAGGSQPTPDAAASPEKMLRCAHCGLHIPSSEAVTADDGRLAYCSDEHRLRHRG